MTITVTDREGTTLYDATITLTVGGETFTDTGVLRTKPTRVEGYVHVTCPNYRNVTGYITMESRTIILEPM